LQFSAPPAVSGFTQVSVPGWLAVKAAPFPWVLGHTTLATVSSTAAATVFRSCNTYRFRDVGADHIQVKKDSTTILLIIGQIPFGFSGVLKIDLATDEAILEPHHSLEGRTEEACAALSA
jgi:hypothetical protein